MTLKILRVSNIGIKENLKMTKSFSKTFSRNKQKNLNLPRKLHTLDGINFLKSLGRTTLLFGHKTTLHGINHIAGDVEDLTNGSHK